MAPHNADHAGRQTWVFDPTAGTKQEREKVESLRKSFADRRSARATHHSSDELLRLQMSSTLKSRGLPQPIPPPSTAYLSEPNAIPRAETVTAAMRSGLTYYQGLQQVHPRRATTLRPTHAASPPPAPPPQHRQNATS